MIWILLLVGLVAGALGAALGVGGGIIFVPALVVFVALDQHLAEGTSLAVIVPTMVVASFVHARSKRIDWRLVTTWRSARRSAAGSGHAWLSALTSRPCEDRSPC